MTGLVDFVLQRGGDGALIFLVMGMLLATLLIGYRGLVPSDPMRARLASFKERRALLATGGSQRRKSQVTVGALRRLVDGLKLTRGKEAETTADLLAKAGYRTREALVVYLGIRLISPVGLTSVVLLALAPMHMGILRLCLGGAAVAVLSTYAPAAVLRHLIQTRQKRLQKVLPDVLDLLVICAEGGLSLDGSISRVSKEFRRFLPEMADELALTSIELGFLPNRRDALMNLAKRVDIPAMRSLMNTLTQTERYGTPLAAALKMLSAELRDERMLKAEEKAARLPAIMTVPMIIFILPTIFVVLMGPAMIQVFKTLHGQG